MLVVLDEAFRRKAIPKVPVFCSGLGWIWSTTTKFPKHQPPAFQSQGRNPRGLAPYPGSRARAASSMKGIFLVSSGMMVDIPLSAHCCLRLLYTEIPSSLWATAIPTPRAVNFSTQTGQPFEFEEIDVEPVRAKIRQFDLSAR